MSPLQLWRFIRSLAAASLLAVMVVDCEVGGGSPVVSDDTGCDGGSGNDPPNEPYWSYELYLPSPRAIAGSSGSDVYTVGHFGPVTHFDGTDWEIFANPFPFFTLFDVIVPEPNRVFAVGEYGNIAHFDGASWQSMASGTSETLRAVWGSSASDVFAGGHAGALLHFDGAHWTVMSGQFVGIVSDIWGSSSSDVFAIVNGPTGGTIMHYNGDDWVAVFNAPFYLEALWGTSPNEVFAVGDDGSILRYDGTWTSMEGTGSAQTLHSIWGSSAADVYALESSAIIHYDGANWSEIGVYVGLLDIWGSAANDVFVLRDGNSVLHFDGTNWTDGPAYTTPSFRDVWAGALGDAFAVGASGAIFRGETYGGGRTWHPMPGVTAENLSGVWGNGGDRFVVGDNGTILRYDGADWSPMISGVTVNLQDVWAASENRMFAVGDGGTILRFTGTDWNPMASGVTVGLTAVWGTSTQHAVAVGEDGTILQFDGAVWGAMESPTTADLFGVWGASDESMVAVGVDGTVLGYSNSAWELVPIGTDADFAGVWGTSATLLIAVGEGAFRFDGSVYHPMYSAPNDLASVHGSVVDALLAVSSSGSIYRYNPRYP